MTATSLGLIAPVLLLGLLLLMERVERAIAGDGMLDDLATFLDSAQPDEVESFVSEGLAPALDRYWKRRRRARLLPGLPR